MVLDCCLRVDDGDVLIMPVAKHLRGEAEHLQVHHVIDDDRIFPFLVLIPGFHHAE